MSYLTLDRHDQILHHSSQGQGWHPHVIIRWLFFLIPLIYFIGVALSVLRRFLSTRQRSWVNTQGTDAHIQLLGAIILISYVVIGLYSVIADAWSTR